MKFGYVVLAAVLSAGAVLAQEGPSSSGLLDEQEQLIRDRYEQVLARNPYQDNAFDRVYEGYMLAEGVDAWLEKLAPPEGQEIPVATLVLQGRIFARQLRNREAIDALAEARDRGEARPELDRLLGQLYYEEGRDDQAIELLSAALDGVENPDERAKLCRILGNVYLRSGKREEAVAAWERLVETSPGDFFALQELAEIYEANRLWEEAAGAYQQIADASQDDPYRKCRALQAIGKARVAMEDYPGAIVAFEAGLDLAAPGNWLFEDLKERLVAVYESKGDLEGLATYLAARLEANPADLEFQELLAETQLRRGETGAAEMVLKDVIARDPGRDSAREMLIRLYDQEERLDDMAAVYEALIARYPDIPDYLRRLGEVYLQHGQSEQAVATWRRAAGEGAGADAVATLAEWFERYEFYPEAIETYTRAIELRPDREWRLRLAGLRYDRGEEAEALAAWQAAVAAEDTPAAELAEVASILLSHTFSAEARALYERAMAAAPDNLDYVLAFARLLVAAEDHEGALPYFERLAAQDDNEYFKSTGELGLLDAYTALGTLDARRAEWEQAVQDNPGAIAPRLKLARLYARSGNRPGAVKIYEECTAIAPDNIDLRRRLAEAYRLNRQNGEAIAALEGLMETDPTRAGGYLRELLSLHASDNSRDEAIATAERLVELAPGNPEARSELAGLYMRYNEQDKALQQYRNLIQLDSDEPAYYRDFGDALARSNRQGEAGEIYRKMLELATDSATRLDAVNRLAGVYVRLGQGDALVAEFQQRVQATPKNLAAYEELAAVHRAAGDPKAAMAALESARGVVEDQEAFLRLVLAAASDMADYERVVSTYEALIALSGAPTVYDLDRLGQAYARAGNMDRALDVWDELASTHEDDAQAQLMVARALREYGYFEEAGPYVEKALAIDPYDYMLRFQYAQELLGRGETVAASAQLKHLLEIGERPPAADGSVAPPPASGGLGGSTFQSTRGIFSSVGGFSGLPSMGHGGGLPWVYAPGIRQASWPMARGPVAAGASFEAMRGMVLQMQVQMAQQAGNLDTLLAEFQEKVVADPGNVDARYDYLGVCEFAGQRGPALEVAGELLALYPGDAALLWRVFRLQQQERQLDAAAATAEKLAASDDPNTVTQALLTLISLHQEREDSAAAAAVVERLASEFGDNAQAQLQLAFMLQQTGRPDEAERFFAKAEEIDPRLRLQIDQSLAQLYLTQGNTEKARERFLDLLFYEPDPAASPAVPVYSGRAAQVHLPEYQQRGGRRSGSGNVAGLPGAGFRASDHQREQAFNQLVQITAEDEALAPVRARIREEAAAYATAETPEAEQRAATFLAMYTGYLRNTAGAEAALAALPALVGEKQGELLVQNLTLYLLEDLGRYEDMDAIYEKLAADKQIPPVNLAQARLFLTLARAQYDQVEARYREYVAAGGSANFLQMVVAQLSQAGEQDRSLKLMEDDLQASRSPDTLAQLAGLYSSRGEHDRAIELAREAWQAQSAGSGRLGPRFGQYNSMQRGLNLQSMGLQHLYPLWNAYEQAGRRDELVREFEEKLAGQPNAASLHQVLIGLHCQNRRLDLAQQQMEKLVALRPNDFGLRMQYAGLLESNGEKEAALAILEKAAQERPGGRQAYGGEILRLYRELNKTEALAAFQERLINEARTPQQMQELAQGLIQQREYGRAAGLYERVVAMEPANGSLLLQVADLYWRDGQKEKAADAYFGFLKTGALYMNLQSLSRSMVGLVQRADEMGRLDALKALVAEKLADPDPLRRWPLLSARIAEYEGRWEDAEAVLNAMLDGASDDTVHTLLAEFAESQGKIDEAIAHVEKIGLGRQTVDNRRLAQLYLKKGDIEQAVAYFKKHGELQGGYQGHHEAIQSLMRADAYNAAESYFLEMLDTIPTGDWSYRQLVDSVLQAHVEQGHFQASTIDRIFQTENEHTGAFAQRLTSDYQNRPVEARDRIAPLASRFPENELIQERYAEILRLTEAYDESLAAYEHLLKIAKNGERYFDRYVDLLGRTGHRDTQEAVLVARMREETAPRGNLIQLAVRTFLDTGNAQALAALREEVLARAPEGERSRIDADFVQAGAPGDARAALLAQYEANPNDRNLREYFQYLTNQRRYSDVVAFYDAHLAEDAAHRLSADDAGQLAPALIAEGRANTAWRLLLETNRRDQDGYNLSNRIQGVVRQMRDYGVSTAGLRTLLDELEAKTSLTLDERLYAAAFEAHLGHGKKALALLDIAMEDGRIAEARRAILRETAPELRAEFRESDHESAESGPERLNAALDAARDAIRAKQMDGAVALLDGMALSAETRDFQVQRARRYLEAGAYDKALADCQAILERDPKNDYVAATMALALAHKGESVGAVEAWQAAAQRRSGSDANELAQLLIEQKAYEAARSVLETVKEGRDPDPATAMLAARILRETGKADAIPEAMEQRYAQLFGDARYRFERAYGEFLQSGEQWKPFLSQAANPERPGLAAALLAAAPQVPVEARGEIASALSHVDWPRTGLAVDYGEVLWRLERRQEAAQVLQAALPRAQGDRDLSSIIRELAAANAFPEAAAALNAYADSYPALLQDKDWVIRIIARSGASPEAGPLEARLLAAAASDVARRFYQARLALARGETPAALALFDALIAEPGVPGDWLAAIAQICQENGRPDGARAALLRLKEAPAPEGAVAEAAVMLINLCLDAGEYGEAIRAFADMLPAPRATVAQARRALLEKASAMPFADVDALIQQRIKEAPTAAGVSDLAVLRAEIAKHQDIEAPPVDLAGLGVSEGEIYETALWGHLINAWRISPPAETISWADMETPLDEGLAALLRGATSEEAVPAGWVANDPLGVYPAVILSDTPWKDGSHSGSGQAAFALAEIESPDDRTVTLAHGSDDWSRVWVNGEEVLSNPYTRVCLIDQDRAEVALHAGRNWILVKCGNVGGDWEFSLSIVENGDGLNVIPPATEATE